MKRLTSPGFAFAFFAALLAFAGALVAVEGARFVGNALERPGVPAFYTAPESAVSTTPGTIVKVEPLSGVPFAARGWRIMYSSTDVHGEAVLSTGVLVVPLGVPPAGGRTVVSWGHPTTGSAPDCAPSYGFDPYLAIEGMRPLLDRGYAVVATDYTGMGVDGPDSYLVGPTEGNNVLDAVRAAQAVMSGGASDRVILWGHSQGGQAVLFAAQQAADYAPELDIQAVAVAAPAADLTALMGSHLDDIQGVTIGSYAFQAFADVYGETVPGAELDTILTPEAIANLPAMNELCLLAHTSELHTIGGPTVGKFVTTDPTKTEPWATLLAENSAGGVAFDAPLFIAQGLKDELVIPGDTKEFAEAEGALGMTVTYHEISFADHGSVAYLALPALMKWLDAVVPR